MRLKELTGYKNDPVYLAFQDTYGLPDFLSKIRELGYSNSIGLKHKLVGHGYYAGVFAKPDDPHVIKIFENDPGYEKYLAYVVSNQTNPHVPKLRGRPITFDKRYRVIRLEKLSPISTPSQNDIYENIRDYIDDIGSDRAYGIINQKNIDTMFPKIKPLLHELASNKYMLDLGKQNVMFRGDIPVITDPYSDFT